MSVKLCCPTWRRSYRSSTAIVSSMAVKAIQSPRQISCRLASTMASRSCLSHKTPKFLLGLLNSIQVSRRYLWLAFSYSTTFMFQSNGESGESVRCSSKLQSSTQGPWGRRDFHCQPQSPIKLRKPCINRPVGSEMKSSTTITLPLSPNSRLNPADNTDQGFAVFMASAGALAASRPG